MGKMDSGDCGKAAPWVLLVVGLLFLGVDLGWGWTGFWQGVNWWSVVFVLLGLKGVLKAWK